MTKEETVRDAIEQLEKNGVDISDGVIVISRKTGTINGVNINEAINKQIPMMQTYTNICHACHKGGLLSYHGKTLGWLTSDYCRWCGQRLMREEEEHDE